MTEDKKLTFYKWLFSMAEKPLVDNPVINGRWGLLHIITLISCIGIIIGIAFLYKYSKNKEKTRKIIIVTLTSLLLFFEVMMRVVRFRIYWNDLTFKQVMWIIIPRPWCAIASWSLLLSVVIKKKFFYNYASTTALLCTIMFFACPGVGFNNQIILFENLYSISTHSLLLIISISLITLGYTDFRYHKGIWKEAVALAITVLYALVMIKIGFEKDPMYFMPNGDIQAGILGISYGLYMVIYVVFMIIYFNAFYLITDRKKVKALLKKKEA